VKVFKEINSSQLDPGLVTGQMESQGYVLVRNLLDKSAVKAALTGVTEVLAAAGWLQPGISPNSRLPRSGATCGDPDPEFKRVYQQVFNLESLHRLPHLTSIRKVMEILAGEEVLVHPKPIGRLIFPNCDRLVTHAHQDYEFMRGDPEFYTVWIPLHDCPVEIGPLRILEGSHLHGVQHHESEGLHVPEIPEEIATGEGWVGGQINAGDVLIFHSLTVHAASPNLSGQMRLSIDCRFQDARRIVNPANLVFAGESGKSWDKTYAGWSSDELKYYWKKMTLALQPSKAELQHLAETAEPATKRARYSRMISQLA
jgi:ectoine hydroxylase-related dioxygenase (phytanoyl-CoA dioxygenase family)